MFLGPSDVGFDPKRIHSQSISKLKRHQKGVDDMYLSRTRRPLRKDIKKMRKHALTRDVYFQDLFLYQSSFYTISCFLYLLEKFPMI